MSIAYSCPPSKLYGFVHPVEAYYFDRAVWLFGSAMDADIEESTEKVKKNRKAAIERRVAKWLDDEETGEGRFAAVTTTRGG